jgi:hypothetical protein
MMTCLEVFHLANAADDSAHADSIRHRLLSTWNLAGENLQKEIQAQQSCLSKFASAITREQGPDDSKAETADSINVKESATGNIVRKMLPSKFVAEPSESDATKLRYEQTELEYLVGLAKEYDEDTKWLTSECQLDRPPAVLIEARKS